MLFKPQSQTITLPNGTTITLETGKLAQQAHGSALITQGKAMLLATVVSEKQTQSQNFLPLSVDYQEKYAAAGKIPGGFLKREGKLSDHEVLVCRLVDRAIRPCFPKNYFDNIQVRIMLLSADKDVAPDPLAALAASTALMLSPVPFYDPISEVRVARIEGKFIINPIPSDIEKADIDIIVAATYDRILMIEGEMHEVDEEDLLQAIQFGHEEIKKHCTAQKELAERVGVTKEELLEEENAPNYDTYKEAFYQKAYDIAKKALPSKEERKNAFKKLLEDYTETLEEPLTEEAEAELKEHFDDIKSLAIRDLVLKENRRIDGRTSTDIREINVEVDCLPSAHGSSLFTRGETQALASLTLGSKQDEQLIDGVTKSGYNKVMLHYDFPSFSTGEVKPNRGPSRREVGHGNLALRALRPILPPEEENPYTMRLHSTILASNGSSSMATVCGCSLALMDAGILLPKTVAGIAMGLISDPVTNNHYVLSDILGEEDKMGDMDFKAAGTKDGLTACQMDIKVQGISYDLLRKALQQAKKGRLHIIDIMEKTMKKARTQFKLHAPRIETFKIPRDTIGAIIGPGGKIIQELQRTTGTTINVSEEGDQGVVYVLAPDKTSLESATNTIQSIVKGPEVGQIYRGKVKSIQEYGAFVEFISGTDGLLHISQVSDKRITQEELRKLLQVGQEIPVKLIKIERGKYSLSAKIDNDKVNEHKNTEKANED